METASAGVLMMVSLLFAGMGGTTGTAQANGEAEVASSKRVFQTVVSELEPGGHLMIVANVEGVAEDFVTGMTDLVKELPLFGPQELALVGKIPPFMRKQGLFACQGMGVSVVPRSDGLSSWRVFVAREQAAADAPMWRLFAGGPARRCGAMDYLGEKTHLARVAVMEPAQVWGIFNSVLDEFATAEVRKQFDGAMAEAEEEMGVSVASLFGGLGDEFFVAAMLDTDTRITLPVEQQLTLDVPMPGLLLGMKLSGTVIPDLLARVLTENQVPLMETREGDVVLKSFNMPVPSPVPIQPTYAIDNGYLLLGLNAEIVREALRAKAGKSARLENAAEYKAAFEGTPVLNNGMFYFSRTLGDELRKVIDTVVVSQAKGEEAAVAQKLAARLGTPQAAIVMVNQPGGVLLRGVSSAGTQYVMGTAAIAPVGLLSAIAIPSLLQAREETQKKMVMNNLRLINAASSRVMLMENLTSYADMKVDAVERLLDPGSLNDMKWPAGVVLMQGTGDDAVAIPGGRIGDDVKPTREVWQQFLSGSADGRGGEREVEFQGERISTKRR